MSSLLRDSGLSSSPQSMASPLKQKWTWIAKKFTKVKTMAFNLSCWKYSGSSNAEQVRYWDGPLSFSSSPNQIWANTSNGFLTGKLFKIQPLFQVEAGLILCFELNSNFQMAGSYYLASKWIIADNLSAIQITIQVFRLPFDHPSNNRPFNNWTTFDHLNTRLVGYSDPHCTHSKLFYKSRADGLITLRNI